MKPITNHPSFIASTKWKEEQSHESEESDVTCRLYISVIDVTIPLKIVQC